jgi:uncharacterized tellurite resistance protein B-like protein
MSAVASAKADNWRSPQAWCTPVLETEPNVQHARLTALPHSMPFKKLFKSSKAQDDGFAQSEREAIVDLLHYCMYADRHIAISEDEMIEKVARTMNWDPNISYEYYEGKSTGAARKALASKESRSEFMKSLHERLKDKTSRSFALKVADDLMKVDGEKKQEEFDALSELKRALRA